MIEPIHLCLLLILGITSQQISSSQQHSLSDQLDSLAAGLGLVDVTGYIYKDNLQGSPWYYGQPTDQQYKLFMFDRTTNNNLITCPLSTPFVRNGSNTCFSCGAGTAYNLNLQKCVTCSSNPTSIANQPAICQQFITSPYQPNLIYQTGSFDNYISTYQAKQKTNGGYIDCPSQTPYYFSQLSVCQACPPATPFFSITTEACVACGGELVYNALLRNCVPVTPVVISPEIAKINL